MAEDLSSLSQPFIEDAGSEGVCVCPCADFSPLIQTDEKPNNLTVVIAAMRVLRISIPPTLGSSILTHALLVNYKMHGLTKTASPYRRRLHPAVPFLEFRKGHADAKLRISERGTLASRQMWHCLAILCTHKTLHSVIPNKATGVCVCGDNR
jgi:hypothetical protein